MDMILHSNIWTKTWVLANSVRLDPLPFDQEIISAHLFASALNNDIIRLHVSCLSQLQVLCAFFLAVKFAET